MARSNGSRFEKALAALAPGKALADPSVPGLRFRRYARGTYAELRYYHPVTGKRVTAPVGKLGTPVLDAGVWALPPGTQPLMFLRHEALDMLKKIGAGIDPRAEASEEGYTLRQALALHEKRLRAAGRSERTITFYRASAELYLSDWLDVPLRRITRTMVRERHEQIAANAGRLRRGETGQYVANGAMRTLRAVWNSARREDEHLPEAPTVAVAWHKERRRQEPIEDLRDWWLAIRPQRRLKRDFLLLVLLTGMREEDAGSMAWADVDLPGATLHRPAPKGGEDRAFSVPLSRVAVALLRRRQRENERAEKPSRWVFPAPTASGHIVEGVRAYRLTHDAAGRLRRGEQLPSEHRLRDTYVSAGHEAGLSELDIGTLVNHRLPGGSVTQGYIRQRTAFLRECQERVTAQLLANVLGPERVERVKAMRQRRRARAAPNVLPMHATA